MKMLSSRTPSAPGLLALALAAGSAHAQCVFTLLTLRNATTTWTQQCDGRWSPAGIIDNNPRTAWALGNCWAPGDRTLSQTVVAEVVPAPSLVTSTRVRVRIHSGGYSACCGGGNLTLGAFRLSVTGDSQSSFADGSGYSTAVSADWNPMIPDVLKAVPCDALGNEVAGAGPTLTILDDGTILASGPDPTYAWYSLEADLPLVNPTGVRLELTDLNGADTAPAMGLPTGGPGRHANGNLMIIRMTVEAASSGAPEITGQPQDQMVCPGGDATLTVSTATAGATFQWRHAGVPIPGANGATLHLTSPDEGDDGAYDCLVSTACDSTLSATARLNVCRPEFNCDGFLDFFDYADFVSAFEAGEPRADYNRDGFLDFFDYGWYVEDFELGC